MTQKNKRGIGQASRRGGWNATRKSLSTDERRAERIKKRATADKRLEKLKRYQHLITTSAEKNEQLKHIGKVVELAYGFHAKPEQLGALWWLLFKKRDLLLVAKTSFGKSVILQLFPCLIPDAVALILLPLNAIGTEQFKKIQTLPGARPIHLTAQNNNAQVLADIRCGLYTHILLSPEIARSRKFRKSVLSNQKLRERIKAVMVDEVHLVVDWGQTFRESYTHLRYLRDVLGEKPWFGCTATLDQPTFKALCYSSGFSRDVRIMRTTVNRPEIAIVRKEIPQRTKSSHRMLYFLVDNLADSEMADKPKPTPQQIKKAVIFFDTKTDMHSCLDTLRTWLEVKKGYSADEPDITVVEYHATLADRDKKRIYEEFKKPDSRIRILAATDALALGCDVPDIEIVVQYGLPGGWNINTVLQRFGRCARRAGLKALGVFFVESRLPLGLLLYV
jgi:superfamily II DNA helicase RecQ